MPDRWALLQKLLEAGVSQGVYTAAVALVGLKGELRWEGAAGRPCPGNPGAAAVTLGHGLRPGLPDQTPGHDPGPDGPGGPGPTPERHPLGEILPGPPGCRRTSVP